MKKIFNRIVLLSVLAGAIVGILVILAIRFFTYQSPDKVHYHANFAVYINGQQEKFKDPFYYEEVEETCSAQQTITPHNRAHMHDNIYNVVHVEDHAVTWGQFFQNIGWDINPWFVKTNTQLLVADSQHPVTFMLNGKTMPTVVNTVIADKDKLLVDFGTAPAAGLQKEYKSIPSTAAYYDTHQDPATCSGSKVITTHDRLTHLF